jgi:hypothetical protein
MKKLQNSTRRNPVLIPTGRFFVTIFRRRFAEICYRTARGAKNQCVVDFMTKRLAFCRTGAKMHVFSRKCGKKSRKIAGKSVFAVDIVFGISYDTEESVIVYVNFAQLHPKTTEKHILLLFFNF